MNVLILTPDAVGSTLLQRLLTIYMQFHNFDRPVINLHELTNGIDKFWSPDFNREILGKPDFLKGNRGYYQSLQEVVALLDSVDHYKTARLSEYHIMNRKDSIADQLPLYRYLNENFFIISCQRQNVFEQSISWAINKITNKLNVYRASEKIQTFAQIYKDPINIDLKSLIDSLDMYCNYIKWCKDHFNVASYFYYDQHVENIEQYILNLPIFAGQKKLVTWKDNFDQEFNDWNRCHYLMADLGTLALENHQDPVKLLSGPAENISTKFAVLTDQKSQSLVSHLPVVYQEFVANHAAKYVEIKGVIEQMESLGILTGGLPMKKQTMAEKKHIVKNFNECVDVYNKWVENHLDIAQPIDITELQKKAADERRFWQPGALAIDSSNTATTAISDQRPIY